VHHSTIYKKNPTRCSSIKLFIIPYLYEAQHVSDKTPPIVRSLKLHWQPLVFHTWKVVGRVACGRCQAQHVPDNVHQPHVQTTFHVWKTRGCQCSFRLLMIGGVSSETCWASYNYGTIKILINSCILLDFSLWIAKIPCLESALNCFTNIQRFTYLALQTISYT